MCKGISILKARIKQELFEEYALSRRVMARAEAAQEELHFMYSDPVVELPVVVDGQMVIYEWGNRAGKKVSRLYQTGWCRVESLEQGKWGWCHPEPAIIPATFGLENGVWFPIHNGIEGIVVRDEKQRPHVYMLTKPSTNSFGTMTKHERMPVLINQEI